MLKRSFCFPACVTVLALLCAPILMLADNVDLASAQPDSCRAVMLNFNSVDTHTQLFSLTFRENTVFSKTPAMEGITDHFVPIRFTWSHEWRTDRRYWDFRDSDRFWKRHPHSVPEPSSLLLLGAGVIGIAFRSRKRLR